MRRRSPSTERALRLLGTMLATERLDQRRTRHDLAERAGISTQTIAKIEAGAPGTAIGTVLEVASLLGIDLFPEVDDLTTMQRFALAPGRARASTRVEDDDF